MEIVSISIGLEVERFANLVLNVIWGGRDFEILGGAATFCDDIGIVPEAHAIRGKQGPIKHMVP